MEPDPSGIHPSSGKNVEDAKIQISLMFGLPIMRGRVKFRTRKSWDKNGQEQRRGKIKPKTTAWNQ
jgi:hypothetical protein